MCKVPAYSRHSIKINKLKNIGGYYVLQTLLCMIYGEHKKTLDKMAYNFKEIKTCIDETIGEKNYRFYQSINCVVKIVKAVIRKVKNPIGLSFMKEVAPRKAFRNWYTE